MRFPAEVCDAMRRSGAAATCVAVRLDGAEEWEAALFFQLAGPESKDDRRILRKWGRPLPVGIETDLVETPHGAVAMLRVEVHTRPDDPLACEILLTPGDGGVHFDALKLLAEQPRLSWFFADRGFEVIHVQQHPLGPDEHAGFTELMRDALRADTMVRMTSRYDASAALGEVARHYELRAGVLRSGAGSVDSGGSTRSN